MNVQQGPTGTAVLTCSYGHVRGLRCRQTVVIGEHHSIYKLFMSDFD